MISSLTPSKKPLDRSSNSLVIFNSLSGIQPTAVGAADVFEDFKAYICEQELKKGRNILFQICCYPMPSKVGQLCYTGASVVTWMWVSLQSQ